MDELPAGADAVLLDFAGEPDPNAAVRRTRRLLREAIAAGSLGRVDDIVPSAETVLVQFESGSGVDSLGIRRALRTASHHDATLEPAGPLVEIPVYYDGADIAEVANLLDLSESAVVDAHRRTCWRVEFMGFAPGFGYLVPEADSDNPLMQITRRNQPRTRVPAGSVAIAAGYSAIYPRESPGGWYLLGHTDIALWDEGCSPPATLTPGAQVTFVDAAANT